MTVFDYFAYDPQEFGSCLIWKKSPSRNTKAGNFAGTQCKDGYFAVSFANKKIKAHKIVWFLHYKSWPKKLIDHINGNKFDNRIENLREASFSENQANKRLSKQNISGIKNVYLHRNKWMVCIRKNKKEHFFGYYADIELAELVAYEARIKLYKEFAKHC